MSSVPPSSSAHPATWKFGYPIYHAESRAQWRAWLEANHDAVPGVWLCSWRAVTGRPTCSYPDVVEEAICFGWIDSTANRLDDDRGMQLLTPRKPKSTWTRLNRRRAADMEAAGLMAPAGRRAVDIARGNGWWTILDPVEDLVEPDDLAAALDADATARAAWQTFPPSARKAMLWWVISAAKPDTQSAGSTRSWPKPWQASALGGEMARACPTSCHWPRRRDARCASCDAERGQASLLIADPRGPGNALREPIGESRSPTRVMRLSRRGRQGVSAPHRAADSTGETIWLVSSVLVASLLAACGSSASNEAGPSVPSSTPAVSLPLVDLSHRPVADDPDPAVRAGAAANFVECDHGVWQGGWTSDFGPLGSGADPDGALDDMIEGNALGIPDQGLRAVGRDQDRVLYTYEVAGSPKLSVVIADSTNVALDTEDRWAVETFASCDPAEFDPSTDDQFPMNVWQDADGNRVPTSVISSARGPEHCGWESATFLTLDGVAYISDPEGVLDARGFVSPFDDAAALPPDATDTGYQRKGRRLWLSGDRAIAFIVSDDVVEAWPSSTEQFGCA